MSDFRLRRLDYSDRWWGDARDRGNPFEQITGQPEVGRRMRVCLHTRGLGAADEEEVLILREIIADYRDKALDVLRTPGETAHEWKNVPAFDMELAETDTGGSLRIRWQGTLTDTWLPHRRELLDFATRRLGDARRGHDLAEMLAGDLLGSDIIVTAERDLLAMRDEWPLARLNVLSPREAFPILGVWSRAINECYLAGPVKLIGFYSWILTRVLLPAAWPGYGAFVYGERSFPGGEELLDLASSILSRLDRLVDALDRMMIVWQTRKQRGLAREFDGVVLGASAIIDNLALLSGKFLGVKLKRHYEWSVLGKPWQEVIRRTGERGERLVTYLRGVKPYIEVSREFRHHAVHRDLLETVGVEAATSPRESGERIQLSFGVLKSVKDALDEAGEVAQAWGIRDERGPERIPVTAHLGGVVVERYERVSQGSALLDPMPFAVRLVAHISRITNSVFEILDPASDPRLPPDMQARARRTRSERADGWDMFSAENSRVALLSSPLSGIVHWGMKRVMLRA